MERFPIGCMMGKKSVWGIINSSKIKSKNRHGLNRKYKGKDMNKKADMSYRSKCNSKRNAIARVI